MTRLQLPAAAPVRPARRLGRALLVVLGVLLAPVAALVLVLAALLGPHLWHQHQAHVAERTVVHALAVPHTWQRTGSSEGAASFGEQPWLDVAWSDPAGAPAADVTALVSALQQDGFTEVQVTLPGGGGNPVGSAPTWVVSARHGAQSLSGGVAGVPGGGATIRLHLDAFV